MEKDVLTRNKQKLEFPGGPVVRTLCFHCRSKDLIPGQATKILHAVEYLYN